MKEEAKELEEEHQRILAGSLENMTKFDVFILTPFAFLQNLRFCQ